MAMDRELATRLNNLNEQNARLKDIEYAYQSAEATRKTNFAQLFLAAEGKSVAEREYNVYASPEWIAFAKALAGYETDYNYEKRRFDILFNAFYAELNTLKLEGKVPRVGA